MFFYQKKTNSKNDSNSLHSLGNRVQVSLQLGQQVFETSCLPCHQATGSGVPFQYPPLVNSEWVLTQGPHLEEHLILIVLHGLQGPIAVQGIVYNGYMAGLGEHLSDAEIASVLSYIRMEWGSVRKPVTLEKVAAVRQYAPARVQPWLWCELQEKLSSKKWKQRTNK